MRDLMCDVTSYCVGSCDMGILCFSDKMLVENPKTEKKVGTG